MGEERPIRGNVLSHTPNTYISIKENRKLGILTPMVAIIITVFFSHWRFVRAAIKPKVIPSTMASVKANRPSRRVTGALVEIT